MAHEAGVPAGALNLISSSRANDTPFGLATYFCRQNVRRIARVSRLLEAGLVGISEAAPFGGIKESGYGRESSSYGLDDYRAIKYLCQGNLELPRAVSTAKRV